MVSARDELAANALWAQLRDYDDGDEAPGVTELVPCRVCRTRCVSGLCRSCTPRTRLKGER